MEPLNHAELWEAHEQRNWGALWEQAVPVVNATVARMKRTGEASGVDFEDLVGEGNLAAGTAVREWRPLDTTFGSWISFRIRSRLLKFIGQQRGRDRTRDDTNVELVPDNCMSVPDTVALMQMREVLASLPGLDQLMVRWLYGIGCEFRSINEIANDTGVHRNSVRQRIDAALERLRAA